MAVVGLNLAIDLALVRQQDRVAALVENRLEPARTTLGNLLTRLVEQETSQRGYLITGDSSFLRRYRDGRREAAASLLRLEQLLAGDPDLEAAVERVAARFSAWQQIGAEVEIAAKQEGREQEVLELVRTGTAEELFAAARLELTELGGTLAGRLASEERNTEQLRDWLTAALVLSALAALVLLGLGGWLVRRWLVGPLDELSGAVRDVAGGELDRPIPAPGPPETAHLGADVEAMRQRILSELDDASRAREALAKRGLLVLSLREELAPDVPPIEGARVAARFRPAEGFVAGDWYGIVDLGPGTVAVALADVSGHGPEAAVLAVRTKELLLATVRAGIPPGEAFAWVARQLGDLEDSFLTGVVAVLDTAQGTLHYANAGHPPVIVGGAEAPRLLPPTGPLVGPFPAEWTTATTWIKDGQYLALYSDGLVEAQDADGEEFGMDRLVDALAGAPDTDPETLADSALRSLDTFSPGRNRDDVTLLVLSTGPSTPARSELPAPAPSEDG